MANPKLGGTIDLGVRITVVWADEPHSITLSDDDWRRVLAGEPLTVAGEGYFYEREAFEDEWDFEGRPDGLLEVSYGEDGAVGWSNTLGAAQVERTD